MPAPTISASVGPIADSPAAKMTELMRKVLPSRRRLPLLLATVAT
jgi:hypothetical protein